LSGVNFPHPFDFLNKIPFYGMVWSVRIAQGWWRRWQLVRVQLVWVRQHPKQAVSSRQEHSKLGMGLAEVAVE